MDVFLAVVWSDDSGQAAVDPDAMRGQIHAAIEGPLADQGATGYVVNVPDHHVEGALIDVRVTPRRFAAAVRVRVPVASTSACRGLLDALSGLGPVSAWSVTGSEPLPMPEPGADGRCDGMANIAFLRRPERITREDWLRTWLEDHTPVALETQSTIGYLQHVVVRPLTADAPEIAGIVEELFLPGAVRDLGVFFDSRGDDSRMRANMEAMTSSTGRFLDDGTVDAVPTSRYVVGVPGPGV